MGSNDPSLNGNRTLIQEGDASRAPLFLIHAAGGGVLEYFKLHDLGRPVYVIRNPWFDGEIKWAGGIRTLVDEYVGLIRSTVAPTGGIRIRDILVGGWSVGGQLALEIARVLNSNQKNTTGVGKNRRSKINAVGIVMIDTLYPYWGPADTVHAEMPVDVLVGSSSGSGSGSDTVDTDTRDKILRMMSWMNEDSLAWGLQNSKSSFHLGLDKAEEGVEDQEPPPTVLIYATKHIPVGAKDICGGSRSGEKTGSLEEGGPKVMTDYLRHDRTLGWDNLFAHGAEFIVANWQVEGHHFELFQKHLIRDTSDKVRRACDLLAED